MTTKTGRPTKETPTVVTKLVAAFSMGYNDTEACFYAGISRNTYYQWLNDQLEFRDKIEQAKCSLNIKAKGVVVDSLSKGDLNTAKWWLKHRAQKEFGKNAVDEDEQGEDLRELQRRTQEGIATVERLVAMKYRAILFVQRERQQSDRLHNKDKGKTQVDELLALSDKKLTDYVELEIYATGKDKAGVNQWLEQRRDMQSDFISGY